MNTETIFVKMHAAKLLEKNGRNHSYRITGTTENNNAINAIIKTEKRN